MRIHLSEKLRRIGWQLPLSIAGLLMVVVAAFSWTAYRQVRDAELAAASERLEVGGRQFASLLVQALEQRLRDMQRVAGDSAVVAAATGWGSDSAARAAMEPLLRVGGSLAAVELWSAGGELLVAIPGSTPGPAAGAFPEWAKSAWMGGIRSSGDVLWYELAVPVRDGERVLGYVLERLVVGSSRQVTALFGELLGMGVHFLVGGVDGVWADLTEPAQVPEPAGFSKGLEAVVEYRDASGERRVGRGMPIEGTQLVVWAESPLSHVLERSRGFLARTASAGLVIVLLGAAGGWVLSRRVTAPLVQVTRAASAIAQGEYGRRVRVTATGELGELADAFNVMAQRVEDAQSRLEQQVAERTAELRQYAAQLEAANRELEAFSYSVSHDLRAPLRSIDGFSQALIEDCEHLLDERGKDHLRRVRAAAERMGHLIDDLLELSRATRSEMRREMVDLSELARRAVAELKAAQPERRVAIEIASDMVVNGDRQLLWLVMRNLLDNAWKFTSRQERAWIRVGVTEDGERAYYVRDNGAGFDMAYANKLFGAFQRLHATSEFPGTGVGLALVQRIVQRHGGRVWAEGAVGAGATFYFTLPEH